ncbi:MAG TPA: hypothetical protein VFW83_09880 [Bryobacteraceae bacterium]|nr:hypothetical protein [Bryobacteraceae bacterium]
MRRAAVALAAALLFGAPGFAQFQPTPPVGQLDGNETLFAVLAAANAAGYDADVNSPDNSPVRKTVRDYLAKQKLQSLGPLSRFLRDERPQDPVAELSQYISFALFCAGPPDFQSVRPDVGWPPDAAKLSGLPPLLAAFYREAKLGDLWKQLQPEYEQALAQYTEPVSRAVLQVNAYLRNPTSGYLGAKFQIFVDLLGAPGQVQTRNYVNDSYVVVTPSPQAPIHDIRHAYLHYLLDPIGIKFASDLKKKQVLGEYAQLAPLLSLDYKDHFERLATESLIKAVESRLDHDPKVVDEALREGFVVTPAFAEQLALYEKQDVALRLYFPDMVANIDVKKEEKRLKNVEFATERPKGKLIRPAGVIPAPQPELTGAAKTLADAEQAYLDQPGRGRDLPHAKELFQRVLTDTDQKPMHAKAYYGLARIAVLERDPEMGDQLFRKALESDPDASTKSWCLLYLGRLEDSQGNREQAQEFYRSALAVDGAADAVREAAQKGLKEAFTKK